MMFEKGPINIVTENELVVIQLIRPSALRGGAVRRPPRGPLRARRGPAEAGRDGVHAGPGPAPGGAAALWVRFSICSTGVRFFDLSPVTSLTQMSRVRSHL